MNRFSFLKYSFITVSSLLILTSCDKDFNEVGADIIGDSGFEFTNYSDALVTTYNQFDAAVQTNNLPVNQLGVIDNGVFGTTTSSFATQLQLGTLNAAFPATTIIEKVELTVPYFSTKNEDNTYKLDSVYGSGKINLQIYRSNKFLRNFDDLLQPQRYFSDEFSIFNSNINSPQLNLNVDASQNSQFIFSAAEQTEESLTTDTTTSPPTVSITSSAVAPRMKIQLDKSYFQTLLIAAAANNKLENNGVFQEFFRGLFFRVDAVGNERALAMMNFALGKITIFYKQTPTSNSQSLIINFTGNTVNLFQNSSATGTLPTSPTPIIASNNLYLKGGAGYHSYIDLFGTANNLGIVPKEAVAPIKANKWLINEANLVFTIDENSNSGETPKRIYLYDAKNKRPVLDYVFDETASSTKPKFSKVIHGGLYTEVKDKSGALISKQYKIRITNHIKNIINRDSTNVRLGISVTEDIANIRNRFLKNTPDSDYFNSLPEASVINPLGVILYGSSQNIPKDKRVKLEIFYTKPN
jgi:Domain of unknown function (DUF4270)